MKKSNKLELAPIKKVMLDEVLELVRRIATKTEVISELSTIISKKDIKDVI